MISISATPALLCRSEEILTVWASGGGVHNFVVFMLYAVLLLATGVGGLGLLLLLCFCVASGLGRS
jgi:hypothetical protein